MTTLVDQPVYKEYHSDEESSEEETVTSEFQMAQYDLDVVDEALLNPHNKEFMDHFGFKIQVKTDDEGSSEDDSSSDEDDDDDEEEEEKLTDHHTAGTSDDDMSSIETTVTSPPRSHYSKEESSVPILKSPPAHSNNRTSIISTLSNKFKRPTSMPPVPAIPLSPEAVSRPSQTFQQRRMSRKSMGLRQSSQIVIKRFTHYDHTYDSEKQAGLKQEALATLAHHQANDDSPNDWSFWSNTLSEPGHVLEHQMDELRHHLAKGGIPPSIRGHAWQIISKSRDLDLMDYHELLKEPSLFEKQIQRDLTRTFPKHPYFMTESGRQRLFRVAKAYSLFDQEVGYCQGLAFVIGCLLIHLPEQDTFSVLVQLMGKYNLRGHFTPKMETLHQHMYQFDNLFQQKLPVVHRHMEHEGVSPSMYASQWFITLFSYRCPIELSFRIMDLLFIEGPQVLVQIAIAIIVRNQEHILKLKFDALIEFLSNGVFHLFQEDSDGFVEDVYRVELPTKLMARLAQQYTEEVDTRDSRSISPEDNLRRINGQLSEHIRSVEGALSTAKTENNELTQHIITSKMEVARVTCEKEQLSHEYAQLRSSFDKQTEDNRKLAEKNVYLANQLSETESILIQMKMKCAEKETEFESLRRQLKQAQK
ncbi:rab-GTPase-TBC domain-containing protein [Sporodiniella umbellata]|nr:rab-GTPase-TBC domain-containing protein [Sporodiniella umbellata]